MGYVSLPEGKENITHQGSAFLVRDHIIPYHSSKTALPHLSRKDGSLLCFKQRQTSSFPPPSWSYKTTSWWLNQPIWKIFIGSFPPKIGGKHKKKTWNHHLESVSNMAHSQKWTSSLKREANFILGILEASNNFSCFLGWGNTFLLCQLQTLPWKKIHCLDWLKLPSSFLFRHSVCWPFFFF